MTELKRIRPERNPFQTLGVVSVLGFLLAGCWPDASGVTPPQATVNDPNLVRVTSEHLHQLNIVDAELNAFPRHKHAIGQIAFNEDASTVVQTPFSGRVTRVLARIGDVVKRGDPFSRSTVRKSCRR